MIISARPQASIDSKLLWASLIKEQLGRGSQGYVPDFNSYRAYNCRRLKTQEYWGGWAEDASPLFRSEK